MGNSTGGHVCDSPQHPPTSVHVSDSGASSTGGGCSASGLTGEINVHISAIFSQQGHSEITCHPGSKSDIDSSLVAVTAVFSTPTSTFCGSLTVLSIPPRSTLSVESEIHLGRKVIPSARMEALMRHYKAAGFSDEVSRLAAAPRKPSTNRMYDDSCFASLTGPQWKDLIR